jgi:hypothetical protein
VILPIATWNWRASLPTRMCWPNTLMPANAPFHFFVITRLPSADRAKALSPRAPPPPTSCGCPVYINDTIVIDSNMITSLVPRMLWPTMLRATGISLTHNFSRTLNRLIPNRSPGGSCPYDRRCFPR